MQTIQKVKSHLKNNKKVYLTGGICLVVGGVIVYVAQGINNVAVVDSFKVQVNSPTTNNILQITLPSLGHPGNAVQCLDDGTIWASQGEAARALGVNPDVVSKHLHGKVASVGGKTLKKISEKGAPLAE